MIFEALYSSSIRGELLLIEGGLCRYHLRRDGQLTILEMISTIPGSGSKMLEKLKTIECSFIFAKCPSNLESNIWYKKKGFILVGTETTKKGRILNLWKYQS